MILCSFIASIAEVKSSFDVAFCETTSTKFCSTNERNERFLVLLNVTHKVGLQCRPRHVRLQLACSLLNCFTFEL